MDAGGKMLIVKDISAPCRSDFYALAWGKARSHAVCGSVENNGRDNSEISPSECSPGGADGDDGDRRGHCSLGTPAVAGNQLFP